MTLPDEASGRFERIFAESHRARTLLKVRPLSYEATVEVDRIAHLAKDQ